MSACCGEDHGAQHNVDKLKQLGLMKRSSVAPPARPAPPAARAPAARPTPPARPASSAARPDFLRPLWLRASFLFLLFSSKILIYL